MALLTKIGLEKLLRRIFETGGMTQDMESDIQRLRDDFDEREGMLRKYGEVYDGEDKDEYDYVERNSDTFVENAEASPLERESDNWKLKYEDAENRYQEMRTRYLDRFFGTDKVKSEANDIMEDNEEDTRRDGTVQTFDELLGTAGDDFWGMVKKDEREDK